MISKIRAYRCHKHQALPISWVESETAASLSNNNDNDEEEEGIVDAEVVSVKNEKQHFSEMATDLASASTVWLQKTFAHLHMPNISKPSQINIHLPNIKMPNLQMPNLNNFSSPKFSTMNFSKNISIPRPSMPSMPSLNVNLEFPTVTFQTFIPPSFVGGFTRNYEKSIETTLDGDASGSGSCKRLVNDTKDIDSNFWNNASNIWNRPEGNSQQPSSPKCIGQDITGFSRIANMLPINFTHNPEEDHPTSTHISIYRKFGYEPNNLNEDQLARLDYHSQKVKKLKQDKMLYLFWLPTTGTFDNISLRILGIVSVKSSAVIPNVVQNPIAVGSNIPFRIITSLTVSVISLLLLSLSTKNKDLVSPTAYFYFVIFLVGISGVTTGYLQNDTFGTAAQISPKYTQAVMSGQGLAGLGASISQIFSILNSRQLTNYGDDDVELSNSAFIYFLSAFIILVISLISYVILTKLPLFLYHHQNKNINAIIEEEESEEQSLLNKNLFNITFTKIIRLVYSIIFVFMITLSLYPSITTSVKSTVKDDERSGYQKDYLFIPLHFLMYNFGDLLGKSLPIIKFFAIKNIDLLMLMSTSRIIFIPLILLCNTDIGDKRLFPLLITNDFLYFFIILLFSFSNGYLASLIMMTGPQIQNVNKGLAGILLTFCMVFGLTIGSLLSFSMRSLSCGGCNPFIN
ncbi:8283_t:CDS:2 [Entrophospora sp. SA101]|nr:8283_t:CDS:2 [Entrophospora sp. SA101]